MKRTPILIALIAPHVIAGILRAADAQPSRQDFRERYGVLADRNIFLKERGRPAATSRPSRFNSGGDRSRPTPEQTYVLTGIVEEQGQYRAYVEDLNRSKFIRLNVGDPVARGKVERIEIDGIQYAVEGQATRIEIGQNLTGGKSPSSTGLAASAAGNPDETSPTTAPTATSSIDPNDPNLTPEQKMKLKRQMELDKMKK